MVEVQTNRTVQNQDRIDEYHSSYKKPGGELSDIVSDTASQKEVAKLFAKMFIARSDVKAIQRPNGEYNPDVDRDSAGKIVRMHGFTMDSLLSHLSGNATFGHYLLNSNSECKLFAFDIDLDEWDNEHPERNAYLMAPTEIDSDGVFSNFQYCNPREIWKNRECVLQRNYFKTQMRMLANKLARTIHSEFDIPTAVTYSGAKGIHVYGFTGLLPAIDVREGAELILKSLDCFDVYHGKSFYKHKLNGKNDPLLDYQCMTVELFPKQVTLPSAGFGNLMRLPLGRNLKNPKDPTFFLDLRANYCEQSFTRRNPVEALTVADQWV